MKKAFLMAVLAGSLTVDSFAGVGSEIVDAFQKRPEYVQPFATSLGTLTNSGWYQSASVDKSFGFSISLPISVVYLGKKDRQYSGTHIDEGCRECKEQQTQNPSIDCQDCVDCQEFVAPTIFGTIPTPDTYNSYYDLQYNIVGQLPDSIPFSDGQLSNLPVLPYLTLQAGFSFYYTELKLRYIGMPTIAGIGFHMPGFALQHDLQSILPKLPVSLSLAANFTFYSASWEPGDDVKGKLALGGLSNFLGLVAGYRLKNIVEFFIEAGWDHSVLNATGEVEISSDAVSEMITLDTKIKGRNAFRSSLNIAFPIGYHPVISGGMGSQFSNTLNIFSFKSKAKK
ncbi:MAG: hypothetical protein GX556_11325 [Fibrobacter sp.]|nr:hypothetical protein [Fibrobacter sp.]